MKPPHPTTAEIMTRQPTTLRMEDRVGHALREMALSSIHHLPVVDARGRLVGLVSHRDLLGHDTDDRLGVVMASDVMTVAPQTPAHEAAYLLLRHQIGSVPVTDGDGRLVGIVTTTDFVRIAYRLLGGRVPADELEAEEEEAQRV